MSIHWSLFLIACSVLCAPCAGQNSTERIRPEPSGLAARAGQSIHWHEDLDPALEEARRHHRPVFWYVPTLHQSPMDRIPEIQSAIMAGPFSWPRTVALLNQHYVPLRRTADADLCERFGLKTVEFIEPGYLVLDEEGHELARMDRLTTFHPAWFLAPLLTRIGQESDPSRRFPGFLPVEDAAWFHAAEDTAVVEQRLADLDATLAVEARWLYAAGLDSRGRGPEARELWRAIAASNPEHPLAAKAAMEAEGHGPFVRGLETYAELPGLAGAAQGSQAPPGTFDEAALWRRGLEFLERMQRANGGFEDSIYDFGGTDSMPNVYLAVTSIVASALLESVGLEDPSYGLDEHCQEIRARILGRALHRLLQDDRLTLNLDDEDERVWAYLYRIRALCTWLDRFGDEDGPLRPLEAKAIRGKLEQDVTALVAMQRDSGAFAHEYANPFVTAQALVTLALARQHGASVPREKSVVHDALALLDRCRVESGAYTYYVPRREARAEVAGGVGRMPLGEHARRLWGEGSLAALQAAVAQSFEHEQELFRVRKYDDHASRYGYGGFFFWYDLHVRTEAILQLPAGRERGDLVKRQRQQILELPELDGAFVDSHELGRSYGTAMALWCLALLRSDG